MIENIVHIIHWDQSLYPDTIGNLALCQDVPVGACFHVPWVDLRQAEKYIEDEGFIRKGDKKLGLCQACLDSAEYALGKLGEVP